MEIRYATPYVSGLRWVLNPMSVNVPVQDQSGNQALRVDRWEPSLVVEITPYIGPVQGKVESYEFKAEPTDLPSVADVLSAAGTDIAAAWESALDQMADIFPILKDPAPGDEVNGPAYYLRLDSWMANLTWESSKAVTAVVGVYDSDTFDNVVAYVSLVFADGESLRQRNQQKKQLQDVIAESDSILAEPPTYPNWANLPEEQKTQMLEQAPERKMQAQAQLDQLNAQLVAPLGDLLAITEVQQSIGALIAATFGTLKATNPDWSQVDVATIMSKFTLPDVA